MALAGAAVAAIVGCVIGIAPLLVDSDRVKRAVERQFAQSAGGEVDYESASLDLFPRPRVAFSGITVRVPGAVSGRITALHVSVAWLPLLDGKVHPTSVRIERPILEVRIAAGATADPFAGYRAALGPIADALVRDAAGMSIAIEGGKLAVDHGERRLVSLSNLEVAAAISGEEISATASATADTWRAAKGIVRVIPGSLAATAQLELSGVQAARLFDAPHADAAFRVRIDSADLTLDAATDGRSAFRAAIKGSAPRASIARAGRTVELGAVSISIDASRNDDALVLGLREFQAGDLIPGATGTLRAKADGTAPVLELRVPVLELEPARAAALALAGDIDAVRAAVEGLPRGTLRDLTLDAAASDFALLTGPSALRVAARVDAATVAVPAVGIIVKNGSGNLLMADGVLRGSELAGEIGRSSFSAGALAVALVPRASLRSLRGSFEADLAEAITITRHLLRGQPEALAGIAALQGRASAAIDYEAGRRASPLVVDLKGMQATGRYRGVPLPLAISRGELRYAGDAVSVRGLAGSAGRSRLNQVAIDIVLGREPAIRAASGDATLVLDEIYPLVASLEPLRPVLGEIKSLTGTAAVHFTRLSGLFSRPEALEFEAAVAPEQVKLTSTALPGPLTLVAGSVSTTPREFRLQGVQVAMLDARVTVSGTASNYAAPELRMNLALAQGMSGAEAIAWGGKQWKLPPDVLPRAPVALSEGRVEWTKDAVSTQGTASIGTDVQAQFDLDWRPGRFDLRRLALRDVDSDAALRLQWSPVAVELGFTGRLHHRTFERVLARPPRTQALLEGDFRASVDLVELNRSTADGTLGIEGLDLGEYAGVPLTIDRLNVGATSRRLRVHDSVLRLAGERLAWSGTVEGGGERLVVDARIAAEALDTAPLLRVFSREQPGKTPARSAWNLPVEGRVAIDAASVAYGEHVFRPMSATVRLAPNRVIVDATDVRLCGIEMPFTATLVPGSLAISAQGTARNQQLAEAVPCLGGEDFGATGTYDLDVDVSASGPPAGLLDAARGTFRIAARSGRIHRSTPLSRALAVPEVAARTQASTGDALARGLDYQEITAAGALEAGRVRLDQGMLDSPSLGITVSGEVDIGEGSLALQGLVAPLDGIHQLLRRTPVLGQAFREALVVVPVSITGRIKDPDVKVLPAAAVGTTLINLMSATFLAPVRLLDSAASKAQGGP